MAPSNSPAYQKDEKVLCYHGPFLYEAKVLDNRLEDPDDKKSRYEYRVHYKGWKNTWDDWVTVDRLRKNTEENIQLAQNLKKELEAQQRATQKSSSSSKKKSQNALRESEDSQSAAGGPRGNKRRRDVDVEKEESFHSRPQVHIHIPDRLKSILVDDWEFVTKHLQVVPLPCATPVSQILEDYWNYESPKREPGTVHWETLQEICTGYRTTFRNALGKVLLYRFERLQYYEVLKEMEGNVAPYYNKGIDEIYGCEHLLRLLVTMPELISRTDMDPQSIQRMKEETFKLLRWLSKDVQVEKYLCVAYVNTSADYQQRAKQDIF